MVPCKMNRHALKYCCKEAGDCPTDENGGDDVHCILEKRILSRKDAAI